MHCRTQRPQSGSRNPRFPFDTLLLAIATTFQLTEHIDKHQTEATEGRQTLVASVRKPHCERAADQVFGSHGVQETLTETFGFDKSAAEIPTPTTSVENTMHLGIHWRLVAPHLPRTVRKGWCGGSRKVSFFRAVGVGTWVRSFTELH